MMLTPRHATPGQYELLLDIDAEGLNTFWVRKGCEAQGKMKLACAFNVGQIWPSSL
jgi:hypothetical protein